MSSETFYQTAVGKSSFDGQWTPTSVIVTLSIGLGFYNSLEMVFLILTTFKRKTGLYFWSLSVCNYGVFSYTLGMTLSYFSLCVPWASLLLLDSAWVLMITGQSLVLYSRLGLLVDSFKLLQAVKWMVIVNTVGIEGTTVVLDWGHIYSPNPAFAEAYFYMEHIQMTALTAQELIISGLYVWKALVLLKIISRKNTRSMIWQLLSINIMIMCMDATLIALQYKHLQLYQESIKGFVYSVKLKLELNILSKLVDLVQANPKDRSSNWDSVNADSIAGQTQTAVRRESYIPDNDKVRHRTVDRGVGHHVDYAAVNTTIHSPTRFESIDEIKPLTPVFSRQSIYTARTTSRESDILYAEALRSLK